MITAVVGTSTVRLTAEDASGNPSTPSSVTVAGTAHDGTVVSLSAVSIGAGGTGVHQATMTVARPTLVTLTWTVDGTVTFTDPVDVIGRMPVTVAQLRSSDPVLASASAASLRDAIELAHDEARRVTGRSWVRRYDVSAPLRLRDERVVVTWPDVARVGYVQVDGQAWSAAQVASVDVRAGGTLELSADDDDSVIIGAEHGQLEPPAQVRWAMLARARYFALQTTSALPFFSERATIGDGFTTTRVLPTATSTGVAEVDAIYRAHMVAGIA